jgi:plastocyanin
MPDVAVIQISARRRIRVMRYASLATLGAFAVAVVLSPVAPVSADTAAPGPSKAPVITVHIKDYKYAPEPVKVHVGDTVAFVNDDDETHTATAVDGTFDSKGLGQKAAYSYTFAKAGTYQYHCKIHASMKGTIVVLPVEAAK